MRACVLGGNVWRGVISWPSSEEEEGEEKEEERGGAVFGVDFVWGKRFLGKHSHRSHA